MSHELDNQHFIPSLEEADAAYSDILTHNREHTGLGPAMAKMMIALMESDDVVSIEEDYDESESRTDISSKIDQMQQEAVVEGDMDAELQDMFHSDTFTRMGIRLAPSGNFVRKAGDEGEQVTSKALEPMIDNAELYSDFLATLSPDVVDPYGNPLLTDTLQGLRKTIGAAFRPSSRERANLSEEENALLTEAGEDALRTFTTLAPQYERLGLDANSIREMYSTKPAGTGYLVLTKEASLEKWQEKIAHDSYNTAHKAADTYEDLENAVTYWGRDLLPEFIEADSHDYIRPPEKQGFGPAVWHIDGGQPYWAGALDFVSRLEQEDRTSEFAEEVRSRLIHSLDVAMAPAPEGERDYADGQREDLLNIKNAFTGREYDAAQLSEYTRRNS